MFWLLLPITMMVSLAVKLPLKILFGVFVLGTVLTICPVIRDLLTGEVKGNSSAQPIYWGNISLTTGFIAFVLSQSFKHYKIRALGLFALSMGLCASLWSGTRGGWVTIPVMFMLFICLGFLRWKQLCLCLLVLSSLIVSLPQVQDRMLYSASHWLSGDVFDGESLSQERTSSQQRLDMWRFAIEHLPKNLLLGGGFAYFKEQVGKTHQATGQLTAITAHKNPHNEYLELLTSRGVVGLFLFLGCLLLGLSLFKGAVTDKELFVLKTSAYILVIQYLLYSLTEVFFTAKYPLVYFCLCFSLLAAQFINRQDACESFKAENND